MALQVTKDDVWAGDLEDRPGGLARVLEPLAEAGVDLECVIARRQAEKPGTGQVFVSPVKGSRGQKAAQQAGLSRVKDVATLRVEGADKPGMGARLLRAIAGAGVNMRGVSAAVMGNKFVAYLGFDSMEDANKAARALRGVEMGGRAGAGAGARAGGGAGGRPAGRVRARSKPKARRRAAGAR